MLDTTPSPDVAPQTQAADTPDLPPATGARPTTAPGRWRAAVLRHPDRLAVALLALGSAYLYAHLLTGPGRHDLTGAGSDPEQVCFWLEWVAKAVTHGLNPLHVTDQNAPIGFNGAGTTMVLAISVVAIPLTLLVGAKLTYLLILVVGLAATAAAWYRLFSRHLVGSRVAAFVGAGFCAYAPPMASHANGHVNIVVHFAIPLIIATVLRLATSPGRVVRRGLLLGALTTVQVLIGEEVLLIAALGFGVLLAAYVAQRPRLLRPALPRVAAGLAIGGALALAATGYVLWYQFLGPQHYRGLPYLYWYNSDVSALWRLPANSFAGNPATSLPFSFNGAAEQNAFFGIPLLVLFALLVAWLWRDALVRAAAFTAAVFAVLSWGTYLTVNGVPTSHLGPWHYLYKLPMLDSLTPARFTFVTSVMIAVVLARGVQRVSELVPVAVSLRVPLRTLTAVALVGALAPIAPHPLPARNWPAVPAFFTDGTWRKYVDEGGTVVAVPVTRTPLKTAGLDWQLATDLDFRIAGGYFLGPWDADRNGGPDHGWFNAKPRPTSDLLDTLSDSGELPQITDADRANAVADLRYWQAQAIVLDPASVQYPVQLKAAVDLLVGPGTYVDGVWVWPVRTISGA